MARKYYIYVIFRTDGRPCYIGKGCGRRWSKHSTASHNRHLKAIVAKAGGRLPTVIIRHNLTEDEAFSIESALIAAIGREDHGGVLVNQADGGRGNPGQIWTERMREKARARPSPMLGKKHTESSKAKLRMARLGRTASDEERAKLSLAHKGRRHSAETRAKMSASQSGERHAMFGRKHTPEARAKIGEWGRNRIVSEETRQRMSEANRRRWAAKRSSSRPSI